MTIKGIKDIHYRPSFFTNHWRKEVWNFFHSVPKLKSTKKYPPYSLVRDSIGAFDDMVPEISSAILEDYSKLVPQRTDFDEIETIVHQYLDWVSDEVSDKGIISSSPVYSKLAELGL